MDVVEATRISARELSRNTSEVLDRVAAGEKIEVTRNGVAIAILTPPDAIEVMTQGLVKAGILESGWQKRQAGTLRRLRGKRTPGKVEDPLGSEVIVEMREEETR